MKSKKKENCDALPGYDHTAITDFLFLLYLLRMGKKGWLAHF